MKWGTTGNACPTGKERAVMAEIVRLYDEEGFSYSAISDLVERRLCEYEGREFRNSAFVKREWGPSKCRRAYYAHKRILEEEGAVSRLLR